MDTEWAVIDGIWFELATPYSPDSRLDDLTLGQRAVYSLTWIHSEVSNGGFDQCFWNSTGYLLPDAIEGANTLESEPWASLLTRAAGIFDPPFPRNRDHRQHLLDQLTRVQGARMRALDSELFELDDAPSTNLRNLFRTYIDEHPHEFFRDPNSEEEAVEALLTSARPIINSPHHATLALAQELLEEAVARSIEHNLDRMRRLAESLLAQIPDR